MYPYKEIEEKWQKRWEKEKLYKTPENPEKKFYLLEMFPYPSGDLHMGHLKNYVIGDLVYRVKRMEGYHILHPMGWDAFGLPAENAAIQRKIFPSIWAENSIKTYKETLKRIGISYDWDKEIATCWPDYYKWTQWLFIFLYNKGLAYRKEDYVNWCPNCNTVLANEQVIEGKCERCKTEVKKKKLTQWFFRITDYAERLLKDLDKLRGKWPDRIIKLQENWIGKSEGTYIEFPLMDSDKRISVFTTRADTLFGVTFLTIAPEHPLVEEIIKGNEKEEEIRKYIEESISKTEIERSAKEKEKSGIFTGRFVLHPFTGEKIPLWIGDYVLGSYGTGAVMGVPAHDERDFAFAKRYNLPIKVVVVPEKGKAILPEEMEDAYTGYGYLVNSLHFTGLSSEDAIRKIQEELKSMDKGGKGITYRLRDWLVSRQRYWGAPIPMVYCEKCGYVPEKIENLPVKLPEGDIDFLPKGRSPLADVEEFINTECPLCGGPARRDPDTMDTFVDSSWYFLRFPDAHNEKEPFSEKEVKKWLPVDLYIGGAEHATKHLIYARFIYKVLYDEGLVPQDEPFLRLFNQGIVHKRFLYCTKCFKVVENEEVENGVHKGCGGKVEERLEMMSKSRGNVVPVGPFTEKNGADVARVTILFAGPAEKDMEWTDAGVEGAKRFLNRIWRLYQPYKDKLNNIGITEDNIKNERELYIALNRMIKGVREDSLNFHFNTALAKMMEFINYIYQYRKKGSKLFLYSLRIFNILLAPFAPHLAEELWELSGNKETIFKNRWPEYDENYIEEDTVEFVIQINGKLRGHLRIKRGLPEEKILEMALSDERIKKYTEGKEIVKTIFIKDKLINIVVK